MRPELPLVFVFAALTASTVDSPEAQRKTTTPPPPTGNPTSGGAAQKGGPAQLLRPKLLPVQHRNLVDRLVTMERVQLEVPDMLGRLLTVEVPLDGDLVTLDLRKCSVRDADFEVLLHLEDGSYQSEHPGPVGTFRGTVREQKGSVVVGSLMSSGLEAFIQLGSGRAYQVAPDYDAFARGDRREYLVFPIDQLPQSWTCGTRPLGAPEAPGTGAGPDRGCLGFCRAEIAFDIDNVFYVQYGQSSVLTQQAAENILNFVNVIFERNVSIRHVLTSVIIRTSLATEPPGYNTTNTVAMLGAMRAEWIANQTGVQRDVAHLLSGRLGGGEAYLWDAGNGVICEDNWAYGVSGSGSLLLAYDGVVAAHELGHNWGADHFCCDAPPCDCGGACPDPRYLMYPCSGLDLQASSRMHTVDTIPEILSEKGSVSCLESVVGNDDFENAWTLPSGGYGLAGTNSATVDGSASCGLSNDTPDVWFVYQPSTSGVMTVDTCSASTDYDTVLSILAASGSSIPTEIACDDDGCGSQSTITQIVEGGFTYWIRVSGWNGSTGFAYVTLSGPPNLRPVNDDWTDPIDISPGRHHGNTFAASWDGEVDCTTSGSPDVWFFYDPDDYQFPDDPIVFSTDGSAYDTVLSLHDANHAQPWSAAAIIACDDDDGPGNSARIELVPTFGIQYLIRVGGYSGASGHFQLGLTGPDSDSENRAGYEIGSGTRWVSMIGNQTISGSASCTSPSAPDRWFWFWPDYDGRLTVQTCGTNDLIGTDIGNDTVLSLHSLDGMVEYDCNDDAGTCSEDQGSQRDSQVHTDVDRGEPIAIRLSHFALTSNPTALVKLDVLLAPLNDDCSSPKYILENYSYTESLVGATNDGDASCAPSSNSPDVWYVVTPSDYGELLVSTCGTNDMGGVDQGIDTVLSLHSGCPGGSSVELGCNDDDPTTCSGQLGLTRDSAVTAQVSPGGPVYIRVATYNSTPGGEFYLHAELHPVNDSCANAIPIGEGTTHGTLVDATHDGEADCGSTSSSADVWYQYGAATGGMLIVSSCGTNDMGGQDQGIDTVLSMHSECPGTVLNQLDCDDDDDGGEFCTWDMGMVRDSTVSTQVSAGQVVYIRVSVFDEGPTGSFVLNVVQEPLQPGYAYCFGESGSGTPCPCSNDNDGSLAGAGCANGFFPSGARLVGSGTASLTNDTLRLSTRHLEPNNAGVYFQGNNDLSPGAVWGDGLRCAGGGLRRLGVRFADGNGFSDTSGLPLPISVMAGNIVAGDTKYYQCWYRNTINSPCGSEFNTSNGYAVTWIQ